jgi:hypothetical protein
LADLSDDLLVIYSHESGKDLGFAQVFASGKARIKARRMRRFATHDDKGNEYQRVVHLSGVIYIKKSVDNRFLDVKTELPNKHPEKYEKVICLN